MTCARFPCSI